MKVASKILIGVFVAIITSGIISIFAMMYQIRDYNLYIQPSIDKAQDERINSFQKNIKKSDAVRVEMDNKITDSLTEIKTEIEETKGYAAKAVRLAHKNTIYINAIKEEMPSLKKIERILSSRDELIVETKK